MNKLVPHYCHLIREGVLHNVLASELVPGDLVTFRVGDRIPADVRLATAIELEIDESNLTGETEPSKKGTDAIQIDNGGPFASMTELPVTERANIAFMGTLVRHGHGTGIVVAVGKETEFGAVFAMMQEVEVRKTPLQVSMDDLGRQLSLLSFAVIGVIVIVGIFQQKHWLEMFTIGVSLAVAAIPEGLPIVVTVTLALGVLRMANRKAIVKRLPSVETLGSVNVICADKTGTLTMNQMTITKVFSPAEDMLYDLELGTAFQQTAGFKKVLQIGNICNNAETDERGKVEGQSTEVALIEVLTKTGLQDQRQDFVRSHEVSFSSEIKYMSVTGRLGNSNNLTFYKGALEILLAKATHFYVHDAKVSPMDDAMRTSIEKQATNLTTQGLRVLGTAYSENGDRVGNLASETKVIFAGFVALYDPPRRGVDKSIASLLKAGVRVVMITGDADQTALCIARRLGIPVQPGTASCLTGKELDTMSERQLQEVMPKISVFARTTPRHKMTIIKALQANGAVVAMTGDGVNDAPALKMADIGISMGKSGTDVAKEAADMILVDDEFSTIQVAVEEGKSIFYNIQNFLTFQLSTSIAALTLVALATLFKLPNPLNAMQILWINILMDGPPAQSLGVEPADPEVMKRPPRSKNAKILTSTVLRRVLTSATLVVCGTMFIYIREMRDGQVTERDTTMTFTAFIFHDIMWSLSCRSATRSVFDMSQNRMWLLAVGASLIGQMCVIYVPFFQAIFQTEALDFIDLVRLAGLSSSVLLADEARKYVVRKNSALEATVVEETV